MGQIGRLINFSLLRWKWIFGMQVCGEKRFEFCNCWDNMIEIFYSQYLIQQLNRRDSFKRTSNSSDPPSQTATNIWFSEDLFSKVRFISRHDLMVDLHRTRGGCFATRDMLWMQNIYLCLDNICVKNLKSVM